MQKFNGISWHGESREYITNQRVIEEFGKICCDVGDPDNPINPAQITKLLT
jgi:hypothetical protein